MNNNFKVLLIIALFATYSGAAQQSNTDSVILYAGKYPAVSSATYYTVYTQYNDIGTQDYPKTGFLLTQYSYYQGDTTLALLYANTRKYLIPPTNDTNFYYGDTSGKRVPSGTALRKWVETYLGN